MVNVSAALSTVVSLFSIMFSLSICNYIEQQQSAKYCRSNNLADSFMRIARAIARAKNVYFANLYVATFVLLLLHDAPWMFFASGLRKHRIVTRDISFDMIN